MPEPTDTPRSAAVREETTVSLRLDRIELQNGQILLQLAQQTALLEQQVGYQSRREERELAAERRADSSAEARHRLEEANTQERISRAAWLRAQLEKVTPTVSQAAGLVLLGAATAIGGVLTALGGWLTGMFGSHGGGGP